MAAAMPGSDDLASISRLDQLHIQKIRSIGEDGVTIDSAEFRFIEIDADSWYYEYSISGYRPGEANLVTYHTKNEVVVMQVLQVFVAGATLENLSFHFHNARSKPDVFNRLMCAMFPIVCTIRHLATLSVWFRGNSIFDSRGSWLLAAESGVRLFLETVFPVLLRVNPVFHRVTVAAEQAPVDLRIVHQPCRPSHRLEYSFGRNQVKDPKAAWTLKVSRTCDSSKHLEFGPAQEMFALFPADNALLKEVVLTRDLRGPGPGTCGTCREDIADLVTQNVTMLERLDASAYCLSPRDTHLAADAIAVASALRCNRSLKEFEYRCTIAELTMLVQVFKPGQGGEINSSLSALKVHVVSSPQSSSDMVDCFGALAPLCGANVAALKEVIVCDARWGLFEMRMSCDDSQPHLDIGCVTLSRLRVHFKYPQPWPWDDLAPVSNSLTALEEVLTKSTALAQVEYSYFGLCKIVLQRTGSSSDLQSSNRSGSFSELKLHLPPLELCRSTTSTRDVVRGWMAVVKTLLKMVATLERVKARVDMPGRRAPSEFERGVQEKVRKELKRLPKKELRGNSCLQSLQVGWWRLVRVGIAEGQWEMRYDGPCLRRPDEYHVTVELQ